MTTSPTFAPASPPASGQSLGWMRTHPLLAYFVLTYLITWAFFVPILLSPRAWNLWPFIPDWLGLVLFILATYCGPLLAGFVVTQAVDGRAGVRQLLHRIVQWRFGVRWYLLILLGYPLLFLTGLSIALGAAPWTGLLTRWPLLLTAYLPQILIGLLIPSLGEETGWRGFALPRLQARHGALIGTLILASLHAFWHLPAYFVPGAILPGGFDPNVFFANSVTIILVSLLWTWVFNNTNGSVFAAILLHATSNATSALIPQLVTAPDDPWSSAKSVGVAALLLIVLTRGQLSYAQNQASMTTNAKGDRPHEHGN